MLMRLLPRCLSQQRTLRAMAMQIKLRKLQPTMQMQMPSL